MQKEYLELWKGCVEFHGHECGGLAVGFRAALYAKELLGEELALQNFLLFF